MANVYGQLLAAEMDSTMAADGRRVLQGERESAQVAMQALERAEGKLRAIRGAPTNHRQGLAAAEEAVAQARAAVSAAVAEAKRTAALWGVEIR